MSGKHASGTRQHQTSGYNRLVPRLVAAVVLSMFTVLTSVDAVCCPDGCTNEEQTADRTEHSPQAGTCVLCVGGLDRSITPVLASLGTVSPDVPGLTFVPPDKITPAPLEHPPRI